MKDKIYPMSLIEEIGGLHPLTMALQKAGWGKDSIDAVVSAVVYTSNKQIGRKGTGGKTK
jgi:hypothetical protein